MNKKPPWPGLPDDYFENPYRSPLTKGELYEWEHDPEEVFEQEIIFLLCILGCVFCMAVACALVIGVINEHLPFPDHLGYILLLILVIAIPFVSAQFVVWGQAIKMLNLL